MFLKAVTEARGKIHELSSLFKSWKAIIENFNQTEETFLKEVGLKLEGNNEINAIDKYNLMKFVLNIAELMPEIRSRWTRPNYDKTKGKYNEYTVEFITNLVHLSEKHKPQVIYKGDNGHIWSLPLSE